VPLYIYNPVKEIRLKLSNLKNPGISSLAATYLQLLGFVPPADYDKSLVEPF